MCSQVTHMPTLYTHSGGCSLKGKDADEAFWASTPLSSDSIELSPRIAAGSGCGPLKRDLGAPPPSAHRRKLWCPLPRKCRQKLRFSTYMSNPGRSGTCGDGIDGWKISHSCQDGILSTVSLVMPKYSPLYLGLSCEGCHFLPFSSKQQNLYSKGHLIQRAL